MGRKLNNRKISNDRKRKLRKKKNKIIIAVEGNNKTEKLYFDNFDDGKQDYSITIAKGNDTDPLGLVKNLDKEVKKSELYLSKGDMVFCVFDVDVDSNKNKIIDEAKKYAQKKGIQVITSTPCIELWFLLHFEYTTANLSNNEVIKRLKKFNPKYEKNINIFPYINKNIDIAILNAKKLEKYQIDNNKKIGTVEANPNTEMYKIVEFLIKK